MNKKMIIEVGFDDKAKEFTLEIDRNSIVYGETVIGFSITDMGTQLVTQSYRGFATALQKNHKELLVEERNALLDQYLEEGGELGDINEFVGNAIGNFFNPTKTGSKAKKKKKPRYE